MNSKHLAGDARRVRIAVYLLTGLALGSGAGALAQEPGQDAEEGDVIVVTGSRIARDVTDASTPIQIISADEIKLSGATSIDKVLSDQPQFVAGHQRRRDCEYRFLQVQQPARPTSTCAASVPHAA